MARIFVDTNVLFPFSVMDLLLALSEDGVHTVVWTDALLDEWERVIVDEHRRSPETASAITAAIRSFFADSKVEFADYQHLIDEMPGPDADDHHHSAAAIAGGATVLLTHNRVDFPAKPFVRRGLWVTDPDTYLCELADELPDEVDATVARLCPREAAATQVRGRAARRSRTRRPHPIRREASIENRVLMRGSGRASNVTTGWSQVGHERPRMTPE